jgi:hypothetical protein
MAKKLLISAAAALLAGLCLLLALGPTLQRKVFYPKPKTLPAVVNKSTEQLLTELSSKLDKLGTNVASALRPGLTDPDIAALETKYNVSLPPDLRALYKWHDGAGDAEFFPGHFFRSLEEALKSRASLAESNSKTRLERVAFAAVVAHRKTWIEIFPDGAGDGYFFDPARSEKEGPFFYNMAEAFYYIWFPSAKNFLAGLVECFDSGAYKLDPKQGGLDADFEKADAIWRRYGRSNAE